MHELPITQSILQIALDAAAGQRITAINLVIGDLSSIVDDSIQFYFDILSRDTAAEGAELRIERLRGTATCAECGHQQAATVPLAAFCESCGSPRVVITGGRELRVESIEVDVPAGGG